MRVRADHSSISRLTGLSDTYLTPIRHLSDPYLTPICPRRKFIVKTITEHEAMTGLKLANGLLQHVRAQPSTLLHYYGFYAIKPKHMTQYVYLTVMKNLLDTRSIPAQVTVNDCWDLKGALFLRTALTPQQREANEVNCTALDLDWLAMERCVRVHDDDKRRVNEQIESDAAFLAEQNCLDYSMLLGCATITDGEAAACATMVQKDTDLYMFGIIDITETWRCRWVFQQYILQCFLAVVSLCNGKPELRPAAITAVPPTAYAKRFVSFMRHEVLGDESALLPMECAVSVGSEEALMVEDNRATDEGKI